MITLKFITPRCLPSIHGKNPLNFLFIKREREGSLAKKREKGEFPRSLVIWTPGFHYCGLGAIPDQGTENPKSQAVLPKERKKERIEKEF